MMNMMIMMPMMIKTMDDDDDGDGVKDDGDDDDDDDEAGRDDDDDDKHNDAHDNDKDDPKKNNYNAWKLFMDNKFVIINVLLLNWLMLLFGYLGEVKYLSINTSVMLGFIPFLIYFYLIYTEFAQFSNYGIIIFIVKECPKM